MGVLIILLLILGISIIYLIISVYKNSKNNQPKKKKPRRENSDETLDDGDDFEDILFTGLILGDMLNNDTHEESSVETDIDDFAENSDGFENASDFDDFGFE